MVCALGGNDRQERPRSERGRKWCRSRQRRWETCVTATIKTPRPPGIGPSEAFEAFAKHDHYPPSVVFPLEKQAGSHDLPSQFRSPQPTHSANLCIPLPPHLGIAAVPRALQAVSPTPAVRPVVDPVVADLARPLHDVVTKTYATELREKICLSERYTRTRKRVVLTLVAPNGLKRNPWSEDLVDQVIDASALL